MASKDSGPSQAVHPARPENVTTQNRDKAIDLALAAIDKQFGKGAIMRLGKDPVEREVHVIPTGSLGLDIALGIGGLPRGRVIEIYGPESSGRRPHRRRRGRRATERRRPRDSERGPVRLRAARLTRR